MVTAHHLWDAPTADHTGYHAIGARVIRRVDMTAVTAASQAGFTWSVVHAVVVGLVLGSVGCHTTSKGVELSCEIDYVISFWPWILT